MVSVFRVAVCAGLLSMGGATIAAAPAPVKQGRVLGGYSAVAVDDPAAIAAAAYAAGQTGEGASLDTIYSAERQSAAGTNWRLDFTLDNSSHWQAVVRQALDGSWSVTSMDEIGE